jgi:hypothetical protein
MSKIFCLSFQRSGTTSVGRFLKINGYKVADWNLSNKMGWTKRWYDGNYDPIFSSKEFIENQVFEDDPWWTPEFYKVLYHKFPESKFILFYRNTDKWFESMLRHSSGEILGEAEIHCKIYRRENELISSKSKLYLNGYKEHYASVYERHNKEVLKFFRKKNKSEILFNSSLDNKNKWLDLAEFLNITNPKGLDTHENNHKRFKFKKFYI